LKRWQVQDLARPIELPPVSPLDHPHKGNDAMSLRREDFVMIQIVKKPLRGALDPSIWERNMVDIRV
jgi:hypothetical protein